jgi:hypothetical protein
MLTYAADMTWVAQVLPDGTTDNESADEVDHAFLRGPLAQQVGKKTNKTNKKNKKVTKSSDGFLRGPSRWRNRWARRWPHTLTYAYADVC